MPAVGMDFSTLPAMSRVKCWPSMSALRSTRVGTSMLGISALRSAWSVQRKSTNAERLPGRFHNRCARSTIAASTMSEFDPTA